jgi:hypothetical protein
MAMQATVAAMTKLCLALLLAASPSPDAAPAAMSAAASRALNRFFILQLRVDMIIS